MKVRMVIIYFLVSGQRKQQENVQLPIVSNEFDSDSGVATTEGTAERCGPSPVESLPSVAETLVAGGPIFKVNVSAASSFPGTPLLDAETGRRIKLMK